MSASGLPGNRVEAKRAGMMPIIFTRQFSHSLPCRSKSRSGGSAREQDNKQVEYAIREDELAEGRVYPWLKRIHEVSLAIAIAVAEEVFAKKLNRLPRPADLPAYIRSQMFKLEYPDYCKK